jgi:hypothetical protein
MLQDGKDIQNRATMTQHLNCITLAEHKRPRNIKSYRGSRKIGTLVTAVESGHCYKPFGEQFA